MAVEEVNMGAVLGRVPVVRQEYVGPREELAQRKGRPLGGQDAPTTVLDEATNIIYGERQSAYGNARENHDRIAAHWQAQIGHKLKPGEQITYQDVIAMMVCVKLSRLSNSHDHRDSYVDIAGYAGVWDKCQRGE